MPSIAPELLNVMLALLAAAVAYATYLIAFSSNRRLPHPPGPQGLPLLGNLKVPEGPSWKAYRQWGDLYGG